MTFRECCNEWTLSGIEAANSLSSYHTETDSDGYSQPVCSASSPLKMGSMLITKIRFNRSFSSTATRLGRTSGTHALNVYENLSAAYVNGCILAANWIDGSTDGMIFQTASTAKYIGICSGSQHGASGTNIAWIRWYGGASGQIKCQCIWNIYVY